MQLLQLTVEPTERAVIQNSKFDPGCPFKIAIFKVRKKYDVLCLLVFQLLGD